MEFIPHPHLRVNSATGNEGDRRLRDHAERSAQPTPSGLPCWSAGSPPAKNRTLPTSPRLTTAKAARRAALLGHQTSALILKHGALNLQVSDLERPGVGREDRITAPSGTIAKI